MRNCRALGIVDWGARYQFNQVDQTQQPQQRQKRWSLQMVYFQPNA